MVNPTCPICEKSLAYNRESGRWFCRSCEIFYNVKDGAVGSPILEKPIPFNSESEEKSPSDLGGCGDLIEKVKKNPSISREDKERIIERLGSD